MQGHDTDRVKMGDKDWHVKCCQCENWFESTRSDASFCSTRCRINYNREPQKLENAIAHLEAQMIVIEQMAEKYKRNERVFEAMKALSKRVNYAVSIFEK